jgi:hypothetical protein
MSLFGISSYVSSAGKNRAVIKVDKLEILQDEMNVKLNNNIRKAQNMFGDSIEINDAMRKNILSNLVKENLTSMIIAREAQKEGVSISDELIQQIIATQPEFMDASGRFSPEALRRQLSYFDMSEQEYINELRQNILDRHLVYSPVTGVKFPQFMNDYIAKIENQQKVFNYVEVNPSSLKIDRTISDEEIASWQLKCSHGATIGRLNEEEQFYMRSRGISLEDAKVLQMISFIAPVLENVKDEAQRESLSSAFETDIRKMI